MFCRKQHGYVVLARTALQPDVHMVFLVVAVCKCRSVVIRDHCDKANFSESIIIVEASVSKS